MRATIYVRYNDNCRISVEEQIEQCKKYANKNNYYIVSEYIDSSDNETNQFKKLMEDSNQHLFDIVLVYSADRFNRDRYASVIYKEKLKQNDVKVISVKENDPSSILMENVLEGTIEYLKSSNRDLKKTILDIMFENTSIIYDEFLENISSYIEKQRVLEAKV